MGFSGDQASDVLDQQKPTQVEHVELYHLDSVDGPTVMSESSTQVHAIDKRLRRKFDVRILLPCMLIWLMAYVDRANIGNSLVLGLQKEIKLTKDELNITLSVFYAFYVFFEIPSNLLCNKLGPRVWLSALCMAFGIITMCTAFVTSFRGLLATRIFLGIVEAGIQPGILTAFGRFYRRHELVTRQGIKASMAALAGSFGGLLATALSRIPPSGILHTWRYIYLIEGLFTVAVGVFAFYAMADEPASASFLSTLEQQRGSDRIATEVLTRQKGHINGEAFRRALLSWNTQGVALSLVCSLVSMTSLAIFMPTLLAALMGYSGTLAELMSVPPYAIAAAICVVAAITSDRWKRRGFVLLSLAPLTVAGFAVICFAKSPTAKYVGIVLATIGAFTTSSIMIAWAVDNSAGPTVRAIVVAYVGSAGNIGAIIATWLYRTSGAPTYTLANSVNLGFGALLTCLIPAISLYLAKENRLRDDGKRDAKLQDLSPEDAANLGHDHPSFRFTT